MATKLLAPLSHLNRASKIAITATLLALAVVVLFDWNWLRPPLVAYIESESGRDVRIDDLDVELAFSLEPTIRLTGVYIENAPWAGERPFATAGEASFTVSLKSVWEGRPVISRLVLVDAEVDMQRRADGVRNWRLKKPDDPSPGRITVQTLEAHRTTIRFANRQKRLEFIVVSSPAEKPAGPLSTRLEFEGSYEDAPFSGSALSSGFVSFRHSGRTFPLRGHMVSRGTRLDLDGTLSDVFTPGSLDAHVRVKGTSLSELHPFVRVKPPPSRRFDIEARVAHTGRVYRFSQLRAQIGETDLSGDAAYDRSGERPRVAATLHSKLADIEDLRALIGMRPTGEPAVARREGRRAKGEVQAGGRVLSSRRLRADRLRAVDAHITFQSKKAKAPAIAALDSLGFTAELQNGLLALKPLNVGIAGGRVAGTLTLDTRKETPAARTRLDVQGIRLERLVPALAAEAQTAGPINGRIDLSGNGYSLANMLADANGSFALTMHSGRISNFTDAKIALNIGKMLSLMLRGDRNIAIHCGAVAFDLRNGVGQSRLLMLDTQQTRTEGVGTLDLRNERWDLLLTPRPKNPGLLTRLASIRVQGSFRDADVSLEERIALGRSSGEASAGSASGASPCAPSPR